MAFNKAKALQEAEKSVSQGKTSQAIKQYLQIVEKDPSDHALLNTIGDLYMREKNVSEALKQFHKLADAYVQEGFTVKAIAIYKKISKVDPNTVDPVLKLGELYLVQGLGREAREQYAQAVEFYRKKNLNEKALETFRKIVALDPENTAYRTRLAEFCEQVGRKADAAQAYLETAEVALRRGDAAVAEPALKKASGLDPKNSQVHLLRARLALSKQQPNEVEKIIASVPELKANPAARQLLLESYLASQKLGAAAALVLAVYRSSPDDFTPLASFSALCVDKGEFDAAQKPLAEVADELIGQKRTGPLIDALRQIWRKSPYHLPTLELIYRIYEQTAEESELPEVLEALAHAYVQTGELEKAETVCRKLINRVPGNEPYRVLLKQVLQEQGKELAPASPAVLESVEMAFAPEPEASPAVVSTAPAAETEEATMVKEAFENSDLFSRYNLVDKAVAELEKVLAVYPDQVDILKRILEVCHRNLPARAAQTAEVLARIYAQRGDSASARQYEQLARQGGAPPAREEIPQPVAGVEVEVPLVPPTGAPSEPPTAEIDLAAIFPVSAPEETPAAAPREVPLDLAAAPTPAAQELDLSGDWEAVTAPPESPKAELEAPPFNYEESRVELDFYLEQGFLDEARGAIQALEEKYPGNPQVAELRQHVEEQVSPAPAPGLEMAGVPEAAEIAETSPAAGGEWELPSAFPEPIPAEAPSAGELPPSPGLAESVGVEASPAVTEPPAAGGDLLGGLMGDLEASLEGLAPPVPPPSSPAAAEPPPGKVAGASASPLSGFLEELGEGAEGQAAQEDPDTHYNLGVAFREMGLLDESIGEFQKVVKGAQKGKFPPNFLQACILLAVCFMDKKMPAIAVKWYLRALDSPDLHEEATLALHYDLGVAYEQAGDTRTALEKFSEVYSQNIDYRDVAEKIRLLQQKPS